MGTWVLPAPSAVSCWKLEEERRTGQNRKNWAFTQGAWVIQMGCWPLNEAGLNWARLLTREFFFFKIHTVGPPYPQVLYQEIQSIADFQSKYVDVWFKLYPGVQAPTPMLFKSQLYFQQPWWRYISAEEALIIMVTLPTPFLIHHFAGGSCLNAEEWDEAVDSAGQGGMLQYLAQLLDCKNHSTNTGHIYDSWRSAQCIFIEMRIALSGSEILSIRWPTQNCTEILGRTAGSEYTYLLGICIDTYFHSLIFVSPLSGQ